MLITNKKGWWRIGGERGRGERRRKQQIEVGQVSRQQRPQEQEESQKRPIGHYIFKKSRYLIKTKHAV